jgi:hypothetical protein
MGLRMAMGVMRVLSGLGICGLFERDCWHGGFCLEVSSAKGMEGETGLACWFTVLELETHGRAGLAQVSNWNPWSHARKA